MEPVIPHVLRHDTVQPLDALINGLALAPPGFWAKKMTLSPEALANVFRLWHQALANFLLDHYVAHDALVGENACHIRTCALIDLALMKQHDAGFHMLLGTLLHDLERIITTITHTLIDVADQQQSVHAFLLKHHLVFFIPHAFFTPITYLIDTFILTLTKTRLPTTSYTLSEKTSYEPIRQLGLATNRAQYFVHHTQKALSASSCAYVQLEAQHLHQPVLRLLLTIKKDAHGRSFLPQFFVAKVLFLRALCQNRSLVIPLTRYVNHVLIDHTYLCFKPNALGTDFRYVTSITRDEPCMVMSGIVNYDGFPEPLDDYIQRLLAHSLLDLILANFASHPQYSGELKALPPPFAETMAELDATNDSTTHQLKQQIVQEQVNFNRYKHLALTVGCSFANPSLLFFNHMYCDHPINILDGERLSLPTIANEQAIPYSPANTV